MLNLLVGLPGSGKSTYAKEQNGVWISSDAIREELFGDVNDQKHNDKVFDTMKKRTINALNRQELVIYDATNLNAKKRMNLLKELRAKVHIPFIAKCTIFPLPVFKCKMNNWQRDRIVPEFVIEKMWKQFQPPFYDEGWDTISIGNSDDVYDLEFLFSELSAAQDNYHDNPHHSSTIGNHMIEAASVAAEKGFGLKIEKAALFHDIGKPFVKDFLDMKGNHTEIAHYYSHANVGAYLYYQCLPKGYVTKENAEIAALIGYHMDYFAGENRIKNMKKLFSKNFMENLERLHECDMLAH